MARQFAFTAVLLAFSSSVALAVEPWIGRDIIRNEKSNSEVAIENYTEAIKLDPDNAMAYAFRGNAWARNGEWDKAIQDYTEAIRLQPKNAMPYTFRGDAWAGKGMFDNAIKDYTAGIGIYPRDEVTYSRRGNSWASKGDFDNAIKDYAEAIRLNPKSAEAYNDSAWLRATCPNERYRDGRKAVADATTACELSEWKDGFSIDTLAAAHAEVGDFENAIKWQEKAIELTAKGSTTNDSDKQKMLSHLELYKVGRPYHESAKK